jgi:hypothetical protein
MRKPILCAVAILAMSGSVSLGQGAAPLTVIRAGTLIDGVSEAPRKNQLIFVRGERLEKVADGSAAIPTGTKVIDLSNATVLPGLIDAHTHIFLWGEDPAKGGYDANILKAGVACDIEYRRIQPGRVCAGAGNAQGRAACRRAGGSTEGGPAATGAWGGLDQGVHDTSVMGGQTGKPGFAANPDGGRVAGDRG